MENQAHSQNSSSRISRRTFFGFLAAAVVALLVRAFRHVDVPSAIQDFFGLEDGVRPLITQELERLKRPNFPLFRESLFYFTFSRTKAHRLLAESIQQKVLNHWIHFLFNHRSVAWPYVRYPDVGDYFICNGLIRQGK